MPRRNAQALNYAKKKTGKPLPPTDEVEKAWRVRLAEKERLELLAQMIEMDGVGRPLVFESAGKRMNELVAEGLAVRSGASHYRITEKGREAWRSR